MDSYELNKEVTEFLDSLDHPLRNEIDFLRNIIMGTGKDLNEGIKWNGPNYSIGNEDRITMRINPHKQIQVILHRGAKIKEKLNERLLKEDYSILAWKENDRAVATFKSIDEIELNIKIIKEIIVKWVEASI